MSLTQQDMVIAAFNASIEAKERSQEELPARVVEAAGALMERLTGERERRFSPSHPMVALAGTVCHCYRIAACYFWSE